MTSPMPKHKLSQNIKRRLKKYGTKTVDNSVTLTSVYMKHKGVCQECGIDTKRIHPPRPNSASVEHIIPLSMGGSHTWDNVELLCHKCNTTRNNETMKPTTHIKTFRVLGFTISITRGN